MRSAGGTRPHLLGMLPDELAAYLRSHGVEVRDGEARRIVAHALGRGLTGFPTARPVPVRVAKAVERLVDRHPLEVVERAADPADGFVKYLFRLDDGAVCEAVRIPLAVAGRFSVCLSSQVGCPLGCGFCATGGLGFVRDLEAWEMVAMLVAVRDEAPGRVTGAVFQGQGEPLLNLDHVLRASDLLAHPSGGRLAAAAITFSTAGVVPGILRLARERRRERLVVSLTSAVEERRAWLMPGATVWTLAELVGAIRAYQCAVGGRVTVAWVVLAGVNTGADEVDALRDLLGGLPYKLNLVELNGSRQSVFRRADAAELNRFRDRLRHLGVPVVRRYSGGSACHAACGQLAGLRAVD